MEKSDPLPYLVYKVYAIKDLQTPIYSMARITWLLVLAVFTNRYLASKTLKVSWVSDIKMEMILEDGNKATIHLKAVEAFPGVSIGCLFSGVLEEDAESRLTVTGCKGGNETTITIVSKLVPNGLVHVLLQEDGSSIIFEPDNIPHNQEDEMETNDIERKVVNPKSNFGSSQELPESVELKTTIWYDETLLGKFNGDHTLVMEWLSKVKEHAATLFWHQSLDVKVNLVIEGKPRHLKRYIQATTADLEMLEYANLNPGSLNSFFCYDPCIGKCWIGWAYPNAACDGNGRASNICSYYADSQSHIRSAKTFVHELGHNIGMR